MVAIELACACQGLEFHRPLAHHAGRSRRRSPQVRRRIPRVEHDRSLSDELAVLARDIRLGELALP